MTLIQQKIEQFKAEAGDKNQYTPEQQKIYTAFTKEGGSLTNFIITDCEGKTLKISVDSATEVRKILLKHYKTNVGTVTAKEILHMFDVIRFGSKHFNHGNYVYIHRFVKKGIVFYTVIKLFSNGKDAYLKSFHSNRGYK